MIQVIVNRTNKMTASEKYTQEHIILMNMLKDLKKELKIHKSNFKKYGSTNYGYVGDLQKYQNEIGDILADFWWKEK